MTFRQAYQQNIKTRTTNFTKFCRPVSSEKGNRVEMIHDYLFIAILPMTTLSISCQFR